MALEADVTETKEIRLANARRFEAIGRAAKVTDEVRKLAKRSSDSAGEINDLVVATNDRIERLSESLKHLNT